MTGQYGAETVADVVAAWDRGETVWSVEMGGLGPGYEQCIQVLMIELLRDLDGKTLPETEDKEAWRSLGDSVVDQLNETLHFSGAQVGVAKSVAFRILRIGYVLALDEIKRRDPSRLIQISNVWPRAPR